MWLVPSSALDKIGPSICVFITPIYRIMHDSRLIIGSAITIRGIPVIVVKMDGMPMCRQFPFCQKPSPPWWQKVAREYKICTLHVTCHSQVKHMWIPIASAPSHFQFQRLSTRHSHFIYCFPQIRQGFMRVNAFCHASSGMAEYHFHRRLVGSCPVKHGGQRVPALMRRVAHFHFFHGVVKEAPEGFVIPAGAYIPFCLSL